MEELSEDARNILAELLQRLSNVSLTLAIEVAKYLLRGRQVDQETKQYIRDIRDYLQRIDLLLRVLGRIEDTDDGITIKEYLRRISDAETTTYTLNKSSYLRNYFTFSANRNRPDFGRYGIIKAYECTFNEVYDANGQLIRWKGNFREIETGIGAGYEVILREVDFPATGSVGFALLRLRNNTPTTLWFDSAYRVLSQPFDQDVGFAYLEFTDRSYAVLADTIIPISISNTFRSSYESFFPTGEDPSSYEYLRIQLEMYPVSDLPAIIEQDDEFIFYVLRRD